MTIFEFLCFSASYSLMVFTKESREREEKEEREREKCVCVAEWNVGFVV